MSCAKTAEPVEIPFGLWAHMGPSNGGPDPPTRRSNFKVERVAHCKV